MQSINEAILDRIQQNEAATYKWLSQTFRIRVNLAKAKLESFAKQHENEFEVFFLTTGTQGGNMKLVISSGCPFQAADFKPLSHHIYSITMKAAHEKVHYDCDTKLSALGQYGAINYGIDDNLENHFNENALATKRSPEENLQMEEDKENPLPEEKKTRDFDIDDCKNEIDLDENITAYEESPTKENEDKEDPLPEVKKTARSRRIIESDSEDEMPVPEKREKRPEKQTKTYLDEDNFLVTELAPSKPVTKKLEANPFLTAKNKTSKNAPTQAKCKQQTLMGFFKKV